MPAIAPARKAAFKILLAVERGPSHSDDLLRGQAVNALSPADRNLATALVLGVLRWQIQLDHQIRPFLKRPNAKLDPEVLVALRLGAFQLLFLDRIPAHAAIGESVELAKQAGQGYAARMVNAVLRKLATVSQEERTSGFVSGHEISRAVGGAKSTGPLGPEGCVAGVGGEIEPPSAARLAPQGRLTEESATGLALAFAHPARMVERWAAFFGLEAAHAICAHGQSQPAAALRLDSQATEDELASTGIELAPGELLVAARIVVSGDVTATAAFHEGRVRLQDEGSQLIAEIAACAGGNLVPKIERILDACAAPGGKTLILAERHPQARMVACESSPRRLAQLRIRLAAYADRVECRLADTTALEEDSIFDLALADVPCSGTGTLGRNPEIRHRLHPEDFARQAARQYELLQAALRVLRPGGCAVYSTCSLEPEENEQVVAAVLADHPHARQLSLVTPIESLRQAGILSPSAAERLLASLTTEGALRLLPGAFHTDGFFIALLELST